MQKALKSININYMRKELKILISSIFLLAISACSSNVSKEWSCRKVDSKLGCVSISDADQASSSSLADDSFDSREIKGYGEYSSFVRNTQEGKIAQLVSRTSDQVGRIWFSPYMDADNNYHESSFVGVVDENSRWEVKKMAINDSPAKDLEVSR